MGLLSKEAAIVIPALAALGWLFLGRGRSWAMATAGALLPTLVWLAQRVQVVLFALPADYDIAKDGTLSPAK